MAKLNLNPGEAMIGSGQMSLYQKQGLMKKPMQGNVFVTNQRACFKISSPASRQRSCRTGYGSENPVSKK